MSNIELTDTDKSVLELCSTLHDVAGYTATLVHDKAETWVHAIYEAIDLLKTHAGDNELEDF